MKKKGFTLVEMLATIILISIIALIAIPNIYGYIQESKKDKFTEDARAIIKAVEIYMEDKELITLPEEGVKIEDLELDIKGENNYTGIVKIIDDEIIIETMSDSSLCGYGSRSNFNVDKIGGDCTYIKE